jgi:hypothetical protein
MPKHILRILRPDGLPCIIQAYYHTGTQYFHEAYFYPLSSEFGDQEPCWGEVEDYPVDSLCNQIIQEPQPITGQWLEDFNEEFAGFWGHEGLT